MVYLRPPYSVFLVEIPMCRPIQLLLLPNKQRLEQIRIARRGLETLAEEPVAGRLKLTDEQAQKIPKLHRCGAPSRAGA